MKQVILLLIFFVRIFTTYGSGIENIKLKNLDNEYVSVGELSADNIVVIDFWATWCKPCLNAIPKINTLYEEYQDQGVSFIGINVEGTRNTAKIKPFSNSLNIQYPVLLDIDKEAAQSLNISAIPTLIILNANLEEVFRHEGYQPGDEMLIKTEIQKLIDK